MNADRIKKFSLEAHKVLDSGTLTKTNNDKDSTILKLRKIFKLGYIPQRRTSYYLACTYNQIPTALTINCFAHACFNLTEQLLIDYDFNYNDLASFAAFSTVSRENSDALADEFKTFVEATGLTFETCEKSENSLCQNEWKVALYYNYFNHDFHFLHQEKNGIWTCKRGLSYAINKIKTMPDIFYGYEYYQTYKISNPNGKEKDR